MFLPMLWELISRLGVACTGRFLGGRAIVLVMCNVRRL